MPATASLQTTVTFVAIIPSLWTWPTGPPKASLSRPKKAKISSRTLRPPACPALFLLESLTTFRPLRHVFVTAVCLCPVVMTLRPSPPPFVSSDLPAPFPLVPKPTLILPRARRTLRRPSLTWLLPRCHSRCRTLCPWRLRHWWSSPRMPSLPL